VVYWTKLTFCCIISSLLHIKKSHGLFASPVWLCFQLSLQFVWRHTVRESADWQITNQAIRFQLKRNVCYTNTYATFIIPSWLKTNFISITNRLVISSFPLTTKQFLYFETQKVTSWHWSTYKQQLMEYDVCSSINARASAKKKKQMEKLIYELSRVKRFEFDYRDWGKTILQCPGGHNT
jgi:hypothetical protein